jgi:hypothetical protein
MALKKGSVMGRYEKMGKERRRTKRMMMRSSFCD